MGRALTIDPNRLPTRDMLMVRLINGCTKAAVHTDRKKQSNRKACRSKDWRKENS